MLDELLSGFDEGLVTELAKQFTVGVTSTLTVVLLVEIAKTKQNPKEYLESVVEATLDVLTSQSQELLSTQLVSQELLDKAIAKTKSVVLDSALLMLNGGDRVSGLGDRT